MPRQALFGHRRLAIIDTVAGTQPMVSDDGRYTLVYNGEIYNYIELRQELTAAGCHFQTSSDTEVLLQLLIRTGSAGITRLNGMFAFVFHDRQHHHWIAARDPFGIKPLYYTQLSGELVFASEIKALLEHPDIQAKRDDHALRQYLHFQFCLNERTLFAGIHKLPPGHVMHGHGAVIHSITSYWNTNYHIDDHHTEQFFLEQLRALLDDALRLQRRSDVPLGGYLSGGLDSSVICALAARHIDQPLPVFHGRFAEGAAYDESVHARAVAQQLGAIYHEAVPTARDFVDTLPGLIDALDEPAAGPGVFPQFIVSRLARKHVTVVLGGQGGDEIFGGYARYLVGYLEQALKGAIFETQEEGRHLVTLESIVPQLALLQQYEPLLAHFWRDGLFEPMDARYFRLIDRSADMTPILMPDVLGMRDHEQLFGEFQMIFNHPDTRSYINKMTHFDQKTLLPALLHVEDRVSMAVSLESRVPLLDTRIVDLVTTMPPPMKFQGGRTKHLFKQAVQSLVPTSVWQRKDKMGFPVPFTQWLSGGPVREFVSDVLTSRACRERGLFQPAGLEALIGRPGVGARALWGALCIELWHQRFIDRA